MATNLYLQYVLELDMCGYVVPLVPREDLSHAQKINALREHRRRWQNARLVRPTFITFPSKLGSARQICFIGGTLVCGKIDPSEIPQSITNYDIYFYRLPSFNKGTKYKFWQHMVPARALRQLTIQPEYDLLVLLEQVSVRADTSMPYGGFHPRTYHEYYKLHLRSMGTNEPHPVVPPLGRIGIDLNITSTGYWPPKWKIELQVFGRLVAAMLYSTSETHIVIWNWLSGSQVAVSSCQIARRLSLLIFTMTLAHRYVQN